MFSVQVLKKDKIQDNWDFINNPKLRHIIERLINESLESYIHRILVKICQAIGRDVVEADNFIVRIVTDSNPRAALCNKAARSARKNNPNSTLPDIIIGFANDPIEFEKNIIHEALHILRWDEDMVESKTQELYKDFHK